jgi:hypothetical protein
VETPLDFRPIRAVSLSVAVVAFSVRLAAERPSGLFFWLGWTFIALLAVGSILSWIDAYRGLQTKRRRQRELQAEVASVVRKQRETKDPNEGQ